MDHTLATESRAVERYLLGEMATAERDAFEEHYFACTECAREVRLGAEFRANAREVLRRGSFDEGPEKKRSRFLFGWTLPQLAPLGACLLLAGVVAYQSAILIPELRQGAGAGPVAAGAVPFALHTAVRGASGGTVHIPAGLPLVDLDLALPLDAHAARYQATIIDVSGRIVAAPEIQAAAGTDTVSIRLNRSLLRAGQYTITLREAPGSGSTSPAKTAVDTRYEFILD